MSYESYEPHRSAKIDEAGTTSGREERMMWSESRWTMSFMLTVLGPKSTNIATDARFGAVVETGTIGSPHIGMNVRGVEVEVEVAVAAAAGTAIARGNISICHPGQLETIGT